MRNTVRSAALVIGVLGLLAVTVPAAAAPPVNWPQFRGPEARGVAEGEGLPDTWSDTENVAWKTDLPGRGWSSPVVWGNNVFLTTVVNTGKSEEPKKGLYFGGNRPDAPESSHRWLVYCLDLESGAVRWEREVHKGAPATPIHLKNSYASETPVTDGERVYAYFGNLGVFCFDFAGELLWKKMIAPHKMRFGWGTAASPVLHEGRLYILNDNNEDSYLLALEKMTGDEVWRVARDEKSNWSTPYIWKNEKRTEIVTPGSVLTRSYDLDGKLLWSFKGMSVITIATPYEASGLLYISSGYVGDKRRPLYAIRPGAAGDITLAEDTQSNEWIAWSHPQAAPYNPTTLVYRGRLYVLFDGGFLSCFDARDGSEVFARTRIPKARAFTTSPWAYDGKVFCLNEDGVTFVLGTGDELEVLHKNTLADDDMGMATPAIAGDRLLIRTSARLYCIRKDAK